MKLGEISVIRIGLILARKKANTKYEIQDTYKLITLKNIEENGEFNKEPLESFYSNDKLDRGYFTQEGDILVRLSHPFTTVYIDKNKSGLLIPSYFAVIKIIDKNYIPEYIAWYLNSGKVKKELIRFQTGTSMTTTNKAILNLINIKEIPIGEQKKIIKIQELYFKERELLFKLIEEKEKYYKVATSKLIKGE
ncbi:MAG: restriction endonuclease subunit S [Tissierellia bacterium]|nr:restriction endonuclease subunit S [Tissierellia bacterium]